ncbi:hypothetical protein ACP70R_021228 [Stipagrostis hirtigluma subsp. patula]
MPRRQRKPRSGQGSSSSRIWSPSELMELQRRRPMYGPTTYGSPWCPPLRTKAWLDFRNLPPHLWTKRTCESAVARFGGVVRIDVPPSGAPEGDGGGRMVFEARITRPEAVPRRIDVQHHVGFGHLLVYRVDVEILALAPVVDDDETAPPGALVMWCPSPDDFDGIEVDDMKDDCNLGMAARAWEKVGEPRRVAFPVPKPEECAGILDDGSAASAVERPEVMECFGYSE